MSGGGGGGKTYSEVSQTTTNLPEYAEPYVKDLFARAAFETAQPYEYYGGQRLADFSPYQQEAFGQYADMAMSGSPQELDWAGQIAAGIGLGNANINVPVENTYRAGRIGDAGNYTNTQRDSQYTAGQYTPGYTANQYNMGFEAGNMYGEALDPYQDKYMQDVVDIQKREAARQGDIRNKETGLDAAGMGGLGGYREAILKAENERNLMQQMNDIQAQGSQQAFLNAQKAYEADRQARAMQEQFGQSAFGMNEQARQMQEQFGQSGFGMNEAARQAQEQFAQGQFGMNAANNQFAAQASLAKYQAYEQAKQKAAELGLTAAQIEQAGQIAAAQINLGYDQNRLAAAGLLGDFAGQRQAMAMERIGALENAGEKQQALQQAGLNTAYQDFLAQQNWGKEQLSYLSDIIHGNQIAPGQTTASYNEQPSFWQQLMGSGIAGVGLYNALNKGG